MATTLLTCGGLQANDHEDKSSSASSTASSQQAQTGENPAGGNESNISTQSPTASDSVGAPGQSQTDRQASDKAGHGDKAQKFIKEASMSGQMEVQMGQMAQQKGQNPEVKRFGETLVRDHTAANQRLQSIAQAKGVQLDAQDKHGEKHGDKHADKHQKHQQHLTKLQGQSGAEFDKEFIKMALKHHKKDIAQFEKAQNEVDDPQLKAFITETLPKLRQHLQMAQTAAKAVGVDESTIAADQDNDATSGVGAAAGSVSGEAQIKSDRPQSSIDLDRQSDRLNGATQTDASLNVNQNNPSISADIDADVDADDKSASIEADADADDGGVFQKGDGKVLGLSTDKQDGKFLGIIPNPRADNDDDADVSVEADVNTDRENVGAPGSTTTESGSSDEPKR